MNRVPIFIPSAPSASAATRPRASPKPPEAIIGMLIWSAAHGMSMSPGMSSSPGWPAHSKPSMLTASHPIDSALTACRTDVHLWITLMPAAWKPGRSGCGLLPAVSTILMPDSTMACAYSAYGTGFNVGRIVRLTPNGLSVISRVRAISAVSASGDGWVSAVTKPSAPALATADTNSAKPTFCMPPCTIGCSIPKASVKRV